MPGAPCVCHAPGMTLAFDNAYEGVPSWETGRLQPVVERLLARGAIAGAVLDAGCGTGRAAVRIAADGSPGRRHRCRGSGGGARPAAARPKSGRRRASRSATPWSSGPPPGSSRDPSTRCSTWACSTCSSPPIACATPRPWHRSWRPGGTALVVAWSDRNPFGYGPERVTRRAIRTAFGRGSGWRIRVDRRGAAGVTPCAGRRPRVAGHRAPALTAPHAATPRPGSRSAARGAGPRSPAARSR